MVCGGHSLIAPPQPPGSRRREHQRLAWRATEEGELSQAPLALPATGEGCSVPAFFQTSFLSPPLEKREACPRPHKLCLLFFVPLGGQGPLLPLSLAFYPRFPRGPARPPQPVNVSFVSYSVSLQFWEKYTFLNVEGTFLD